MNRDELVKSAAMFFRGDAYVEISQAFAHGGQGLTHAVSKITELMADFCLDYRRSGWVAVSDRLPSKKGRYLVRDKMNNPKDCVHIAYWSADRSRWMAITNHATDEAANKNIIEWMPIPPAPED